jgi:bifunctional NMN adenylyltransferase/nudix hydrolase
MTHKYDIAVFIGRFSPLHLGHTAVIEQGLKQAKSLVVIIGSTGGPRNHRNPFTYEERAAMIHKAFPEDSKRIITMPLEDTVYNNEKWVADVQASVTNAFTTAFGPWHPLASVALIGHNKDNSSFYLKLFPQWHSVGVKNYLDISATTVREDYFGKWDNTNPQFHNNAGELVPASIVVPPSTLQFLKEFSYTADYATIKEEYEFVATYKKSWEAAPYAPIFVTVDAVVIQSGHILLVQRGARPGKGLWALPGGFVNQQEMLVAAMLRELREETKLKVPEAVLRGSITASRVFDDPYRSSRGRTITHAYLVHLPPSQDLPKVKGSDDAKFAKWVPISEVTRSMMFEDHYDIITTMAGLIN